MPGCQQTRCRTGGKPLATPAWALCAELWGQTASRADEEARGGLEKRRAPCAKCRAGLNDPAQRSSGTCHLAQLAVHPDSCKRDLGAVTAKTFLQGRSRLGLLGFQVWRAVWVGVGRTGPSTLVALVPTEPRAGFARKSGPCEPPAGHPVPSVCPHCPPHISRHFSNKW